MQSQQRSESGQQRQLAEHELVFMMGEELKKPLTAIKVLAESGHESSQSRTIIMEAQKAVRSIDNMLLYRRIDENQLALELEPVHIGSTLSEVVHTLQPLSLEHGCETEVFIQSGIASVDAHPQALRASIESLWQAVIGMAQKPSAMTWHVSRSKSGIRVTITNATIDVSQIKLSNTNKAIGVSMQPFRGIPGSATDLVTASRLFDLLGGTLRKTKRSGLHGFTVVLPECEQLAFV